MSILSWLFFSFLYLYLISGSSQKKLVSFPPSVLPLSKHFLEIRYFFFFNFGMMLRTHTKLCLTELHFFGTIFSRKNWKNWPKIGFLWIYWTIYSICSVMKTQTIFLPGYQTVKPTLSQEWTRRNKLIIKMCNVWQ